MIMGEIADMMLEGVLDEETGEYIGDINEAVYGSAAPGFPVSYEPDAQHSHTIHCPVCGKSVKHPGYANTA